MAGDAFRLRRVPRRGTLRARLAGRLYRWRGAALGRCEVVAGAARTPLYYRRGGSDESVIRQIFLRRDYDLTRLRRRPEIEALLGRERAAGRRPLILDGGANIGVSAIYFALTVPGAHVVAVEPEAANFALLQRNARGLDVACRQAALAGRPGRARIIDPGEGAWAFQTATGASEDGLPCITVGELLDEFAAGTFPFLVKLDIEGAERDVFTGDTSWVEQVPIIVTELHDWLFPGAGIARPFLQRVAALDRDFVQMGENILSLRNPL